MPQDSRNLAANGYLHPIGFIVRCLSLLKPGGRLDTAGYHRAQLCGQQAITLKKLDAAISAAGEELQVSGHKMRFAGGHDLR